jgi:hypothetical protein
MELAVRPVRALQDGVAQAGELLTPVVRIDVMKQRLDAIRAKILGLTHGAYILVGARARHLATVGWRAR